MATNFQRKNPFVKGYTFTAKPEVPKKSKGTTGLDSEFTRLISSDEALVIPEDDFDKVRRTFDRFCKNNQITGEYSFRRRKDHRLKTYTIWLDKK
jgi:hypothetical protein